MTQNEPSFSPPIGSMAVILVLIAMLAWVTIKSWREDRDYE